MRQLIIYREKAELFLKKKLQLVKTKLIQVTVKIECLIAEARVRTWGLDT